KKHRKKFNLSHRIDQAALSARTTKHQTKNSRAISSSIQTQLDPTIDVAAARKGAAIDVLCHLQDLFRTTTMHVIRQNLIRTRAMVMGLALVSPSVALAQLAPAGTGDHHAARASDTGFAGEVGSSGRYNASVQMDLPSARGGLPVPVQVVFGGRRFGAA